MIFLKNLRLKIATFREFIASTQRSDNCPASVDRMSRKRYILKEGRSPKKTAGAGARRNNSAVVKIF
jgi:hypothetical protein